MNAVFIKDLPNFAGTAKLWCLDTEYTYDNYRLTGSDRTQKTTYVVTSAADTLDRGPETFIFPADSEGEILSWIGLPGSLTDDLDHDRAIQDFLSLAP